MGQWVLHLCNAKSEFNNSIDFPYMSNNSLFTHIQKRNRNAPVYILDLYTDAHIVMESNDCFISLTCQ